MEQWIEGEEGDKNGINGMELRIATDGTGD